jgi:hypothetical protein
MARPRGVEPPTFWFVPIKVAIIKDLEHLRGFATFCHKPLTL